MARVEVRSKCVIAPAAPSAAADMFLSCLDIFWRDVHYNRRVLFFRGGPPPAVDVLKKSLSEVLVAYYPWAGRLALDPRHHRLVLRCNDAGVEFVEASVDCAMCDLDAQGFQMKPFYDELSQNVAFMGDSLYTSPLLSVQVTRFADGGLSLGVTHSHVAGDGQSLWNFMLGWGECARGQALSIQPLHDRRRLALPDPSEEKADLNFDLPPLEHLDRIVNDHVDADTPTPDHSAPVENSPSTEDPLVQCVFIMPREAASKLKAQAGGAFSSYVVTCAHFWQRVAAAAAAAAPPSDRTFFGTLANLRNRLSPPLTPSYFGNALRFAITRTAIRNVTCEGLAVTAQRVNAAVAASLDVEALLPFMHWLELHDNRVIDRIERSGVALALHVASSPRFPFYEVDFGWGPPAAVRSARVHGNGEMVFFGTRPGLGAGDVEICMPLPSSTMHRLLQDKDFLAYPPASPFQ